MRSQWLHFYQKTTLLLKRWVNAYVSEWPTVRYYLLQWLGRVRNWIGLTVIAFMWISFEGYARTWEFLQVFWADLAGMRPTKAHRALFCLSVSLFMGHLVTFTLFPFLVSWWSLIFWMAHAVVIHTYWERGAQWCRLQLGIRPSDHGHHARTFDGLDLGN